MTLNIVYWVRALIALGTITAIAIALLVVGIAVLATKSPAERLQYRRMVDHAEKDKKFFESFRCG